MSLLAGKLQLGIETLEDVLKFLRELETRGVSITTLKAATKNPAHLDAIVEALESQEVAREERLAHVATLADELPEERLTPLLEVAFPHRPHLVRMFSERAEFKKLLERTRRLKSWQCAAIVMYYGLGVDGRQYTSDEIAETVQRAPLTVSTFLTLTRDRINGGTAASLLADAYWNDRGRAAQGFSPLMLSTDTQGSLARNMDVRNLKELRYYGRRELEEALSDDKWARDELMPQLERHRIPLWQ